jgi:hypothetical protein
MNNTHLKTLSASLKLSGGAVALIAALAWIVSARSTGGDASSWNAAAATLTAIATGAQGISALIDWRVPPFSTWA